jgi:hypothetical protein
MNNINFSCLFGEKRLSLRMTYSITDKNQNEQLYQSLIYAALMAEGADVEAESQTADARPVWAVGMNISQDHRTIDSYRIVQVK